MAEVLDVVDGDTFVVRFRERTWLVDLHHVDAPELGQALGYEAQLMLREMLKGRWVVLVPAKQTESRISASVELSDETDPEARLLRAGLAWARPGSRKSFRVLQEEARRKELGLWQAADPEPPWQFRKKSTAGGKSRRER